MLLELTVKNCHFLFNGVLYQQVDGVAMGSPLGPLFSNIFLSLHEGCWLDNCPTSFKPLFYHHYVDDCFLIFQSADHIPQFRSYFNQQHPNINFTCEVESNSTLPFLNISIMRTGGRFETSVYQTPTFTGLFTNFHSFIPSQYKLSLISSLLHRFFNTCSSYEKFHAQLDKFRMIFNRNGYPTRIFDRCKPSWIKRFIPRNWFIVCLRKLFIFAFLKLEGILFKFALVSHSFSPMLLSFSPLTNPICPSSNSTVILLLFLQG